MSRQDHGLSSRAALVTGVAGFIGSRLAERLLDDGTRVVGVDRLSDYYDPDRKLANLRALSGHTGFTFHQDDLAQMPLTDMLRDVDTVYHLAGQPGVRPSWGATFDIYVKDNVAATQRLLEAAKTASLTRFVYASSSSVYGDAERFPTPESEMPRPISLYGVTKLAAEHLCLLYARAYGVPAVSLRYFTVYGPGQRPDMAFSRFIQAAVDSAPIVVLGDGQQSRDFTYVDDIVAGTVAAAERGRSGEVYNLAGGSVATVMDAIAIIARCMGTDLEIEHHAAARGDARATRADTAKAARDLDFHPSRSLEEGLAEQVSTSLCEVPSGSAPEAQVQSG